MKPWTCFIAIVAFCLSASTSSASFIVEFEIDDGFGDKIQGQLLGLEADGNDQEVLEVIFNAVEGHDPLPGGYLLNLGTQAQDSTFEFLAEDNLLDLDGGEVTAAELLLVAESRTGAAGWFLALVFNDEGTVGAFYSDDDFQSTSVDCFFGLPGPEGCSDGTLTFGTVSFSSGEATSVSAPPTACLLLLGLLGAGLARRRTMVSRHL